jgi:predicted AAA+ superfamily ATPase
MDFDPDAVLSGQYLIQRLDRYNPWWEEGARASVTGEYQSLRSEASELLDNLCEPEDRLLPISGPSAVGKTSLIHQLISALIDPEFLEKFIRDTDRRDRVRKLNIPSSNILYLPLNDDPIFQLHPADQIRAAVDHFETHVVRAATDQPQYIFLDDIHVVGRPNKRGNTSVGQWEQLVADLLTEDDQRKIVFTALDQSRIWERLNSIESHQLQTEAPDKTTEVLPIGFDDFLRMRHRELASTPEEDRFDSGAVRDGLKTAVQEGNVQTFVSQLEAQASDALLDESTVRRELTNYTTVGGRLSLRLASEGVPLNEERFIDVIRGRDDLDFNSVQESALADFRDNLLRGGTGLGEVKDVSGLERLCALAAHERPTGNVRFDELIEVLDIDRRTLRTQYRNVLSRLHVLSAASEYDNQRPRNIRLYLRDTGLMNAFCGYDLNDVLRHEPGLDESLAKAATFYHTIRLSNEINHPHDPKRGVVKFWSGTGGNVDFVPKLSGRPVPILWSYNRGLSELRREIEAPGFDALQEFLEDDVYRSERDPVDKAHYQRLPASISERYRRYAKRDEYPCRYDSSDEVVFDREPSFGIVLTNSRTALEQGVTVFDDGPKPIVQIPLWTYLRLG